ELVGVHDDLLIARLAYNCAGIRPFDGLNEWIIEGSDKGHSQLLPVTDAAGQSVILRVGRDTALLDPATGQTKAIATMPARDKHAVSMGPGNTVAIAAGLAIHFFRDGAEAWKHESVQPLAS